MKAKAELPVFFTVKSVSNAASSVVFETKHDQSPHDTHIRQKGEPPWGTRATRKRASKSWGHSFLVASEERSTRVTSLSAADATSHRAVRAKPCLVSGPMSENCGKMIGTPPLHVTHNILELGWVTAGQRGCRAPDGLALGKLGLLRHEQEVGST